MTTHGRIGDFSIENGDFPSMVYGFTMVNDGMIGYQHVSTGFNWIQMWICNLTHWHGLVMG